MADNEQIVLTREEKELILLLRDSGYGSKDFASLFLTTAGSHPASLCPPVDTV